MPLATSPSGAVVSLLRSVDGSLPHGRQVSLLRLKESFQAGEERKAYRFQVEGGRWAESLQTSPLFPLLSKLSDLFPRSLLSSKACKSTFYWMGRGGQLPKGDLGWKQAWLGVRQQGLVRRLGMGSIGETSLIFYLIIVIQCYRIAF